MSRNAKVYPTNTQVSKKPYCKVCHDAGKPESEYTSHWVRSLPDRTGNTTVTCPTLLSTECRYCYKLGHTAKFCPVIEQNKKEKERADRRAQAEAERPKQKVVEHRKNSNLFAAFGDESSEEEEVKVSKVSQVSKVKIVEKVVEEFPALAPAKSIVVSLPKVQTEAKSGWAAALAKPKEDIFMKRIEEVSIMKSLPQSARKAQPVKKDYSKEIYTKSWADWTDSDDSDAENPEEDEDWQPSAYMKDTMPNALRYSVPQPSGYGLGEIEDDDW